MSHRAPSPGPRSAFDARTISPLDWGILACGCLAFIFSFMSYYTFFVFSATAWHGFFGWFAALVALAAATVLAVGLFLPQVTLPHRPLTLAGFGVATLCVILAGLVDPSGASGLSRGAGYYLSLVVILAGFALAYVRSTTVLARRR